MYTANPHTKILDFRGSYSSRILIVRGGILLSIRNFPESLSQAILAGRFLVGRLGVGGGSRGGDWNQANAQELDRQHRIHVMR